ncbi:hypothetical protein B0T19DRAFT_239591 [Cercophora scortea]|uniref:Uncharacterized protein n=1 Tax=Cercophora scortea TaxID=314031 RepID=A0AAE0IHI5_9PEZI|nr:hypothetical protein B0T19DRAFT_239591 [Cercophora scortea]
MPTSPPATPTGRSKTSQRTRLALARLMTGRGCSGIILPSAPLARTGTVHTETALQYNSAASVRANQTTRARRFNMSNDPTVRRLLPQSSQMGAFSFAPPAYQQPRESQKSVLNRDEPTPN